jgi:hypothetical protein
MSEVEESRRRGDGGVEAGTDEPNAAEATAPVFPADRSDVEVSDLSDTGVGIGSGEANTFEPEEAAPAADSRPMQ